MLYIGRFSAMNWAERRWAMVKDVSSAYALFMEEINKKNRGPMQELSRCMKNHTREDLNLVN